MTELTQPGNGPQPNPLRVKLLSWPTDPLETIWVVWEQSRHDDPVPDPQELADVFNWMDVNPGLLPPKSMLVQIPLNYYDGTGYESLSRFRARFDDTVSKLFDEHVPVAENLNFTFQIEDIPIALREQMVRHRIGSKVGDRIGTDIVPDLASSTFWSQSHRVLDMSKFVEDGHFFVPPTLHGKSVDMPWGSIPAEDFYVQMMTSMQNAYNKLVAAGVPREDARNLIPLGTTHRTTWTLNLQSLSHVVGKRSCWLLQRGLWEDLIQQAIGELAKKVHPMFRKLVSPPCVKSDKFVGCPYLQTNKERVDGRDLLPPCPLFLHFHEADAKDAVKEADDAGRKSKWWQTSSPGAQVFPGGWATLDPFQRDQMQESREGFANLWMRSVDDWSPLNPASR